MARISGRRYGREAFKELYPPYAPKVDGDCHFELLGG
jgi:hypothetical protein